MLRICRAAGSGVAALPASAASPSLAATTTATLSTSSSSSSALAQSIVAPCAPLRWHGTASPAGTVSRAGSRAPSASFSTTSSSPPPPPPPPSPSPLPTPPAGSHAATILQAAKSGTFSSSMMRKELQRAQAEAGAAAAGGGDAGSADPLRANREAAAAAGPQGDLAANPYVPRVQYNARFATSKRDPADHGWAQAGKYYDFGSKEEIVSMFPNGIAGDIIEEWAVTKANAMLIRPTGVKLVQHLEAWRQTSGRELAKKGQSVKDIDPKAEYKPRVTLTEPPTREAALLGLAAGGGGGAASSSAAATATPAERAFAEVEKSRWEKFHPFRLLTGPKGSGKSSILNYVVQYARKNGWIVVYVPDAYEVMNFGKVLVPSKSRPGMVDQHDMALKQLKELLATHTAQLTNVPQRRKYAKHRYLPPALDKTVSAERNKLREDEEAEKAKLQAQADAAGKVWDPATYKSKYGDESDTNVDRSSFTLRDMVTWGVAHPPYATDALIDVLAELQLCTEHPVLIAVDAMNELYDKSPYPEAGSGALLPPERLSLPSAFHCVGPDGFRADKRMKRGLWLGTVSFKHTQDMTPMFEKASIRGRFRVPVPPLSRQEVFSTLSHFARSGSFLMLEGIKTVDPFLVEYYRMLSSGLPKDMFDAALFTPEAPAGPRPKNFRDRQT